MYDYIIVGQGLAGSILTATLLQKGQKVLVIDNQFNQSSSMVAAGLFNPIVFKRLNKSWMADELIPKAKSFYNTIENQFDIKLWNETGMVKLFNSFEDQNNWHAQSSTPGFERYLTDKTIADLDNDDSINTSFGYGFIPEAGNLNIPLFLHTFQNHLLEEKLIVNEKFDHDELKIESDAVQYKTHQARKIIFCEGFQIKNNPWFNWLPFGSTKGEVLTIQSDEFKLKQLVNKGVFVLPRPAKNEYLCGATFSWNSLDVDTTEEGKNEILEKLKDITSIEPNITNHQAGIRPTVADRRPVLGQHPEQENLMLFNGLGTKGVMIAPLMAEILAGFLIEGKEIPQEMNLNRWARKHYFLKRGVEMPKKKKK